jgi:membrane protein
MGAITQALNVSYDVEESRPWWKQRLVAVVLTISLSVLVITALLLMLWGGRVADFLAAHYQLGGFFPVAWKTNSVAARVCVHGDVVCVDLLLRAGCQGQKWKWLTPGSVIGVCCGCSRHWDSSSTCTSSTLQRNVWIIGRSNRV